MGFWLHCFGLIFSAPALSQLPQSIGAPKGATSCTALQRAAGARDNCPKRSLRHPMIVSKRECVLVLALVSQSWSVACCHHANALVCIGFVSCFLALVKETVPHLCRGFLFIALQRAVSPGDHCPKGSLRHQAWFAKTAIQEVSKHCC